MHNQNCLIEKHLLLFPHCGLLCKNNIILKSIIAFIYIYSLSLKPFPQANTRRLVCIVVLGIIILFRKKILIFKDYSVWKTCRKYYIFQLCVYMYTSILILFLAGKEHGTTISGSILEFLVFGLLGYIMFLNLFDNIDELMHVLLIVTVIQCIIIFSGILFPWASAIIDHFMDDYTLSYFNYSKFRLGGYAGGIGCITSTGSMQLSLGMISASYFIQTKKNNLKYFFLFMFITFISVAVARTSFILSMVAVSIIIITSIFSKNFKLLKNITSIIFVLFIGILVINFTGLASNLPQIFKRFFFLVEHGSNSFFLAYFDNKVPPISLHTIIGTGIISGDIGNGTMIIADGGFFRMYTALGLPLSIILYLVVFGTIFKHFLKAKESPIKYTILIFLCYLLIGEIKEPYLYTNYMLVIYTVFVNLAFCKERKCNKKD